jgi:hypothetical protein
LQANTWYNHFDHETNQNNSKIRADVNIPQTPDEMKQLLNNLELDPYNQTKGVSKDLQIPFGGFIENIGQNSNSKIQYYMSTKDSFVGFGTSVIYFSQAIYENENIFDTIKFNITFGNSNTVDPFGMYSMSHSTNYFIGNSYLTNIRSTEEIWYYDLYPNIDLRYYMSDKGLKYDFVVNIGGDPSQIVIQVSNEIDLSVDSNSVVLSSISNLYSPVLTDSKLHVYQDDGSIVPARFEKMTHIPNSYGFVVDKFNKAKTLIIDPIWLGFSSYFGGNGDDSPSAIAIDEYGNIYITGYTQFTTIFPLLNEIQGNIVGGKDLFISKINSTGNGLIFSTLLGGSADDVASGIAIDSTNNIIITGTTGSNLDFPIVNAIQPSFGGGNTDAFILKLNTSGTGIEFSSYIGGSDRDEASGVAVDASKAIYLTGITASSSIDFPVANAFQPNHGGGGIDGFVMKLNASGDIYEFSTFIGGSGGEEIHEIVVDEYGNSYIVGGSSSGNYPVQNAFNETKSGSYDIIISKLNATGNGLNFSTYLGGNGWDEGFDITIDNFGCSYLVGFTYSTNFPTKNAFQTSLVRENDIFVTKLNETGNGLNFSTYLGGFGWDEGSGIAIDGRQNIYITGYTQSADFPIKNAFQDTHSGTGNGDSFITKLDASGSGILYSTFLGGDAWEKGTDVAVDAIGNCYFTGFTQSFQFPTTVNAFQGSTQGSNDGFIVKIKAIPLTSTFLGGSHKDMGHGITIDQKGNYYITGMTYSGTDFVLKNPYQDIFGGYRDAFVVKLNSTGNGLIFSTFIGGANTDNAYSIVVDEDSNVYIAGYTSSSTFFPIKNAFQDTFAGGAYDIFVTKLNSTGNGLVFSTFIGGSAGETAYGIAIDTSRNVYITGTTDSSTTFPLENPYQDTFAGGSKDVFVTKLNSTGNGLVFSTFIGGNARDTAIKLQVDQLGNSYITGSTSSNDFPLEKPYQNTTGGGDGDGFFTKLNSTGNGLIFSSYLGGNETDSVDGIKIDHSGNVYVGGFTASKNFPIKNAYQNEKAGLDTSDIYVTKFNASGTGLIFSTYLGGSEEEYLADLCIDRNGNIYVAGQTTSIDFPLQNPYQSIFNGGSFTNTDIYISKLNSTGNGLVYSTYFGGTDDETVNGAFSDEEGRIYVIGNTYSTDFPVINSFQEFFSGSSYQDAFILQYNDQSDDGAPVIQLREPLFDYINNSGSAIIVDVYDSFSGLVEVLSNWDGDPNITRVDLFQTTFPSGDGKHNLFVYAKDAANNWVNRTFTFITDDTKPEIVLTGRLNDTSINSQSPVHLDFIENNGIASAAYQWNGDLTKSLSYPWQIQPPGTEGQYTLNLFFTDFAGNTNNETFLFTVDNTKPQIQLMSPQNNSVHTSGTSISLNVSDDNPINEVLYNWDSSNNQTTDPPYIITLPANDSLHTLRIYVQDEAGNWESKKFSFTADDTKATIELLGNIDGAILRSGTNISISITEVNLAQVLYNWDSVKNSTLDQPYSAILPAGDQSHILNIYTEDDAGNWASKSFSFITDDTKPVVEDLGANLIYQSGTIISLNINEANIDQVFYNWDDANSNLTLSDLNPVFIPDGDGLHNLQIYVKDKVGLWGSATFIFTTDDTPPTINYYNPDQKTFLQSDVEVMFDITDLHNILVIKFNWNDANANTTFGDSTRVLIPKGNDNHTLMIYALDTTGNWAEREFKFTSDNISPEIETIEIEGTVSGNISINILAYDFNGIEKIEITIGNFTETIYTNSTDYTYNLDTTAFNDDNYIMEISVTDLAGNIGNKTVSFNIDNTKESEDPTIPPAVIYGLIGLGGLGLLGGVTRFIRGRRFDRALDDLEESYKTLEKTKEGKE